MTGIAKALLIIKENEVRSPHQFARLMWPNSPCWQVSYKVGNYGSSKGAIMPLVAGGFLGKLRSQRLILQGFPRSKIILSSKGEERLRQELRK